MTDVFEAPWDPVRGPDPAKAAFPTSLRNGLARPGAGFSTICSRRFAFRRYSASNFSQLQILRRDSAIVALMTACLLGEQSTIPYAFHSTLHVMDEVGSTAGPQLARLSAIGSWWCPKRVIIDVSMSE